MRLTLYIDSKVAVSGGTPTGWMAAPFAVHEFVAAWLKENNFAAATSDSVTSYAAYNDDADAGANGLTTGQLYQTTGAGAAPLNVAGILMVKQ